MEYQQIRSNVMDRFSLAGKTAVITGAAGNIGYHTALALAQVEELQGVVVFLASEASSYIVGEDILVDGGHHIW